MKEILLNTIFILSLSTIIALLAAIFSYKTLSSALKIMAFYTGFSTIVGGIISIMSIKGINNIFLVNAYSLVEFLIIASAFLIAFDFKKKTLLHFFIAIGMVAIIIYGFHTIKDPNLYNNTLKAFIAITMSIIAVSYLILQFYKGELEGKGKSFLFLAVGTFMYFASSFLIGFIGSDNANLTEIQVLWIYLIHSIFYLIFVVMLTTAFLICKHQSEHSN